MTSYIAGMHATMVLGELLKNQFGMASRWDLANGWNSGDDMGMFNAGDEPDGVSKWNQGRLFTICTISRSILATGWLVQQYKPIVMY